MGVSAVAEANERLRELGYDPEEASAQDERTRVRLTGMLLTESSDEPGVVLQALRMLPPKADLLTYRSLLGIPETRVAAPNRCPLCGGLSNDGTHWFRVDAQRVVQSSGPPTDSCPACHAAGQRP